MNKHKILFSIVCFRENFKTTETFKNLVFSFNDKKNKGELYNSNLNIFIYDNTDIEFWNVDINENEFESVNINYERNKDNPGISYAYNQIANYALKYGYEYIVFLDQDTKLPLNFYETYINYSEIKDMEIAVPIVMTGDKIFSPSIYKNFRCKNFDNINEKLTFSKNITCINSGLLIKTNLFFLVGGYDEKLRLDFCDHEFIKRLLKVTAQINLIPIKLHQAFSTETNSLDKALFRYDIFLHDLFVFKKINNANIAINLFLDWPHLIKLSAKYRTWKFLTKRIFCFL
ncbi:MULTISPECIES: hypothetical protein [Chryseobacterium]|uniref:hypothetical protein n=1 Tax=Chryseobacterium TaxID=59732 RepID=UPI001958890E|nr:MULTISPECIES: hypothetical protein [Chryseobacterium]MBM7419201.1 GT2 family glycosyltransferase [Chryseobacterium sp. JUb44]MDH6209124.1 GT2 family glycosyltransferase [Chryseobacterium sp. BIGb0186]WSO11975.1 hypothetical protein VUJ64_08720 [Chryseobacterium scophthalmum]